MGATLLDNQNFKIDSTGWEIQEATWIINGKYSSIKVKIHPKGDVREYVSGVPAPCIGQQLFTFVAALRETEKSGTSLPGDQQVLHQAIATMPGDTQLQKYKNYLTKSNVQLVGCYSSGLHLFDDIWVWAYYWLDDGTRLHLNATTRSMARRDEMMWYSIRTR